MLEKESVCLLIGVTSITPGNSYAKGVLVPPALAWITDTLCCVNPFWYNETQEGVTTKLFFTEHYLILAQVWTLDSHNLLATWCPPIYIRLPRGKGSISPFIDSLHRAPPNPALPVKWMSESATSLGLDGRPACIPSWCIAHSCLPAAGKLQINWYI